MTVGSGLHAQEKAQPQTAEKSATPKAAGTAGECVQIFFTSLLDGDQCRNNQVTLSPTQLDRLAHQAMIRFAGAADRFRSQFVKTYGKQAWEKFNDPNHVPHDKHASAGANGAITVMQRALISGLVGEAIGNASDNHSSITVPNSDWKLRLVRRKGRWFVRSETLSGVSEPKEVKKMANFLGGAAVEMERYYHAIGIPGLTPDDIDYQFGLASMRAMGMRAMGMQFAFRIEDRFSTRALPKPKPYQVIGELKSLRAIDHATAKHYAAAAKKLWKDFLSEHPGVFIQAFAPEIRSFASDESISELRSRVGKRWTGIENEQAKIEAVTWDAATGYRVNGTIGSGDDFANFEAYEVDDHWTGLVIEGQDFGIDTRNLTGETKRLSDQHSALFSAAINGDAKSAYAIYYKGREPAGEHFKSYADGLPTGMRWKADDLVTVRVASRDANRVVHVYSTCRIESDGKSKKMFVKATFSSTTATGN